jgi:hypothetical protein
MLTTVSTISPLAAEEERHFNFIRLPSALCAVLTIINPANPLNPSDLIAEGDAFFGTDNILRNLQVYSIVGIVGGLVSVLTMLIPYPIMYVR